MDIAIRSLLDFALEAAWQAGRVTLGYFQTDVAVERKGDNSPVTVADRQSEQLLRTLINHAWPGHGIIGEEFGQNKTDNRYTWIVDPIDGTQSFIHGVPLYAVLIGLLDGDTPLVGVAHFPALNETVYAARGEGCFWNGRRAHVSTVGNLKDAALMASAVEMGDPQKNEAFRRLLSATHIHRTWGDAYGYVLVATGRAEVMLDSVVKIWDCAPFPVILEEAGGTFTDWKGKATITAGESIATNGSLFDPVMKLVHADLS